MPIFWSALVGALAGLLVVNAVFWVLRWREADRMLATKIEIFRLSAALSSDYQLLHRIADDMSQWVFEGILSFTSSSRWELHHRQWQHAAKIYKGIIDQMTPLRERHFAAMMASVEGYPPPAATPPTIVPEEEEV